MFHYEYLYSASSKGSCKGDKKFTVHRQVEKTVALGMDGQFPEERQGQSPRGRSIPGPRPSKQVAVEEAARARSEKHVEPRNLPNG